MSKVVMWSPGATEWVQVYLNGQWVDITTYVLDESRGQPIQGDIGRQTELSGIDPTNLSLTLENRDGRFTPGNVLSPYYPYWKSGVPLRWSTTVGARTFPFPDMWVEIPEVSLTFEDPTDSTNTDRVLTVQAVDLLTRLNRAPRFYSNMAAYIVGQRKTTMIGYWPLLDASPFTNALSGPAAELNLLTASVPPLDGAAAAGNPGGGTTVPGDDLPGLRLVPARNATQTVNSYEVRCQLSQFPAIGAGGAITLVLWINLDGTYDELISLLFLQTFDGGLYLDIYPPSLAPTPAKIRLNKPLGATTGSVTCNSRPRTAGPHLVALRYSPNAGTVEIWLDALVYSASLSGTLASDNPVSVSFGGAAFLGTIAHGQLYAGDATDFDNDDFLAQWRLGLDGLEHQSVDQRIRSIGMYAGLTDAQMDLEASDSLMPEAEFANARPGELASSAAQTGGGILFTRGDQLVYQDRKHRYNL